MQRRELLLVCCALALNGAARGNTTINDEALWAALRAGGLALLLRHAVTEPGIGDPPGFRLGDCSTQRNLSAEGRAQASRIGRTLSERGVVIGAVLSSRWCRCVDTARLAFPDLLVEEFPGLDSFFARRDEEPALTAAALARIVTIAAPFNAVLVTHQVNILALTGEVARAGEAIVVRPSPPSLQFVGRLQVD
jgi:phosphohistidine phosphatase SixA